LFAWAKAVNARSQALNAITLTQRLLKGASVITSDTTATTAADGWTSLALDWTPYVIAPSGNRTQEAFPNAPANAIGLGTGAQILGLSSAYTANRDIGIQVDDEAAPGTTRTIIAEYFDATGTRLAFDAAPQVRVYKTDPTTGAEVEALALTVMTRIAAGVEAWKALWVVPTVASGNYIVEVRGQFSGGAVQGSTPVAVKPRYLVDPTGLFK